MIIYLFYSIAITFLLRQEQIIDLNDLRWSYRIICIEALDKSSIEKQINELCKSEKEIDDRKLKILVKSNNEYFEGCLMNKLSFIKNFPPNKSNHNFSVSLIGLDGGKKSSWHKPVQPTEIFKLIDTMPMRINEMRNGKNPKK